MSDFHQTGDVATLHALDTHGLGQLEWELEVYSRSRPIALVLPLTYAEFRGPAMRRIGAELRRVGYLRQIVVALSQASEPQFEETRRFFDTFPQQVDVLWVSGRRMQRLWERCDVDILPAAEEGRALSCWLALGYVLATGRCDVVAIHDCDILSYERRLLARLCYPVASPRLGYTFSKGYYARFTDRLHGRVTRLLLSPLLGALLSLYPAQGFLRYLNSFRYPLAGEAAMSTALARSLRVPGDWSLEVGLLEEAYRRQPPGCICQVDVADQYEHEHHPLSESDPERGLMRMACDIAKTLFRALIAEGVPLSDAFFRALEVRYVRAAEDAIECYAADAQLNGLAFDRHEEELAVSAFARAVRLAGVSCREDLKGSRLPSWHQVLAAIPDFAEMMLDAVAMDNEVPALQLA